MLSAADNEVFDTNFIHQAALQDIIGHFTPAQHVKDLIADLDLDIWARKLAHTQGGAEYLSRLLHDPTTDVHALTMRATTKPEVSESTMKIFSRTEAAILWLQRLPPLKDAWPLPLLFPLWPIARLTNHVPPVLDLFHVYRGYLAPFMHIVYPLTSILAPFFYMRRTMRMKIAFQTYCSWISTAFKSLLKLSGNLRADCARLIVAATYAFVFLYGLTQSLEIAAMVRKIRRELLAKLADIKEFVSTAAATLGAKPIPIPKGMSGIYAIWNNLNGIRDKIACVAREVYALDVAMAINGPNGLTTQGYCRPTYVEDAPTRLWEMGHPLMPFSQQRNPCALEKNIIITGPNAAGKTTYMKAAVANNLLAQTLGVCYASRAEIAPVHFFGSFTRTSVSDAVGYSSLFEAEVQRCGELFENAQEVSNASKRALLLLDEPMHSTPPIEGASTAMAVIEALGKLPGVRVLATTHYHDLTTLESQYPELFVNISMEAIEQEQGGFLFPYRLKKGASFQCIAIELMESSKGAQLPESVILSAIKFKKLICKKVLNAK